MYAHASHPKAKSIMQTNSITARATDTLKNTLDRTANSSIVFSSRVVLKKVLP
jgi:hypothetical protein